MNRSMLVAVLGCAISAASCERPDSSGLANEPAPVGHTGNAAADPAMERTAECVNRQEGYIVRYPATWQVNTGVVLGPCSLFDPEPIEIARDSEVPVEIGVMIDLEPVPFATVTGEVLGRRDLTRERTIVDGRQALRIVGESTGEGLHDRGLRSYQYFVDYGETTMIATTYDAGSLPFERKRRILDAMMDTFAFRQTD